MRDWLEELRAWFATQAQEPGQNPRSGFQRQFIRSAFSRMARSRRTAAAAVTVVAFGIYFTVGGMAMSVIDDNLAFRPTERDLQPGGSVAVAMTSAVLNRELSEHSWSADDPWFYPTAFVDNMPAFQCGISLTAYRFVGVLRTQNRQNETQAATDPDLAEAFEALSYPCDRWWIGTDWPWLRTASGFAYDDAVDAIRQYNSRISRREVQFNRDAAELAFLLSRLTETLGNPPERGGERIRVDAQARWAGAGLDEQFHAVRGQAYATYLILAGLREDFGPLIRERQLAAEWADMMLSLETCLSIDPLVVTSGSAGGLFIKNHLMEQGYALKRTQEHARQIAAALRARA